MCYEYSVKWLRTPTKLVADGLDNAADGLRLRGEHPRNVQRNIPLWLLTDCQLYNICAL